MKTKKRVEIGNTLVPLTTDVKLLPAPLVEVSQKSGVSVDELKKLIEDEKLFPITSNNFTPALVGEMLVELKMMGYPVPYSCLPEDFNDFVKAIKNFEVAKNQKMTNDIRDGMYIALELAHELIAGIINQARSNIDDMVRVVDNTDNLDKIREAVRDCADSVKNRDYDSLIKNAAARSMRGADGRPIAGTVLHREMV